jgi:hypothetical protein
MNITLTERQCEQLAALKHLRELAGRPWLGDEHMALSIFSRGIVDELDDERFITRITEPGPLESTFGAFRAQAA